VLQEASPRLGRFRDPLGMVLGGLFQPAGGQDLASWAELTRPSGKNGSYRRMADAYVQVARG